MDEGVKRWAYIILALRLAFDLALAVTGWILEPHISGAALMLLVSLPLYFMLWHGLWREYFYAYPQGAIDAVEGWPYWVCAGFIVLVQAILTGFMIWFLITA